MKASSNFVSILALTSILAGCAAIKVEPDKATVSVFKPEKRPSFQVDSGGGSVTIIRDYNYMESLCPMYISVNREKIGKLYTNEKLTFNFAPGQYFLNVQMGGLCGTQASDGPYLINEGSSTVIHIGVHGLNGAIQFAQE